MSYLSYHWHPCIKCGKSTYCSILGKIEDCNEIHRKTIIHRDCDKMTINFVPSPEYREIMMLNEVKLRKLDEWLKQNEA